MKMKRQQVIRGLSEGEGEWKVKGDEVPEGGKNVWDCQESPEEKNHI